MNVPLLCTGGVVSAQLAVENGHYRAAQARVEQLVKALFQEVEDDRREHQKANDAYAERSAQLDEEEKEFILSQEGEEAVMQQEYDRAMEELAGMSAETETTILDVQREQQEEADALAQLVANKGEECVPALRRYLRDVRLTRQ
jgi:outer membrane protein TolC